MLICEQQLEVVSRCQNPDGEWGDIAVCQGGTWINLKGTSSVSTLVSENPSPAAGSTPCSSPTAPNGATAYCALGSWWVDLQSKRYGNYKGATLFNSDETFWVHNGGATNVTLWSGPYGGKKEIIIGIQLHYGDKVGNLYGSMNKTSQHSFPFINGNYATGVQGCKPVSGSGDFIFKLGFFVNGVESALFPNGACGTNDENNLETKRYQLAYIDGWTTPETTGSKSVVGKITFYFYSTST